ncbi:sugar phosphate isomerase/epimerase family protein [Planctomyces sp. SH-PL14]|uniref:sugar phosphate isomerase/epimerase family protein n=1 Tax=Planctomyces sp. SH-PL14 TaxID=1632864 RepID=UPI00078BD86E|nr:sugar phosphate isomerase/epimerase family protein [Planctomyces sp. SH-PL14]AMV16853.1 Xylose isomerase-like TIM barrel [Planctomyces sp. SH-PL14]
MMNTRRQFLKSSAAAAAGLSFLSWSSFSQAADKPLPFKISLAEWSLHRALFGKKLDHLDFAKTAKEEFGIDGVEYVNQFFKDKAKDEAYLGDMKKRAGDLGVKSLLIMIDGEGALGHADETERHKAVDNHKKWLDAASFLGCHSIRVNAQSSGTFEEQMARAADGLGRLTELAEKQQLSVLVENHGGLSSNGEWLAGVMKMVNHPHCGTLPDFGNFKVSKDEEYDRYKGVDELMPFAHAVSAKSHDFDDAGNETHTDYRKMMKIVYDHGYRGYVGVEYEGGKLDEYAGIRATKKLLETVRDEMLKA